MKEYLIEFPEQRLVITHYERSQTDYAEEAAEILSLYLRNPYFLKLISKDHHDFMKRYIKSYVPCTAKKFIEIYNLMNLRDKENIFKKWDIVIEHDTQIVIKTK
jgi:hypothetical protein